MAERTQRPAKIFLLSRAATLVCCAILIGCEVQASGNGLVPGHGYYCYHNGPDGNFSQCDAVVALSIVVFIFNFLLFTSQLVFQLNRWLLAGCELFCFLSLVTICTMQGVSFSSWDALRTTSDRDTLLTGMVFSSMALLLTVIHGILCWFVYRYADRNEPLLNWEITQHIFQVLRTHPISCLAIFLLIINFVIEVVLLFKNVMAPPVHHLERLTSRKYNNFSCFNELAAIDKRTCQVDSFVTVISTVFVILFLIEAPIRLYRERSNKMPPIFLDLMVVLFGLVVFVLNVTSSVMLAVALVSGETTHATSEFSPFNSRERFDRTSEIGFSFVSSLFWFVLCCIWHKRLHAQDRIGATFESSSEHSADCTPIPNDWNKWWTALFVSMSCLSVFSWVVFSLLYTINYDGLSSQGLQNSSCAYVKNEAECQFVIALPIATGVCSLLSLSYLVGKYVFSLRDSKRSTCKFFLICQLLIIIPWIIEAVFLTKRAGSFGFGKPQIVASVVFTIFCIISLVTGIISMFLQSSLCRNHERMDSDNGGVRCKKEDLSHRLAFVGILVLIGLIFCSAVVVGSVSKFGRWSNSAHSNGNCIFGDESICSAVIVTSGLSLVFAVALLAYLVKYVPDCPSLPFVWSFLMFILSIVVSIIALVSWNGPDRPLHWGQAHQYNAGYTACGGSVIQSLLWLVVTCTRAYELLRKRKGTFFSSPVTFDTSVRTRHTSPERPMSDVEDNPLDGFAAETGALAARRPLSFLSHPPTFRRRHANHCRVMNDCWEFVKAELNVSDITMDHLFNPDFDNCYCEDCHRQPTENAWCRGKELYIPPEGWCRFGLNAAALIRKYGGDEHRATTMFEFRGDGMSQGWPVAYHGTASKNIRSILDEGRLLAPGQRCKKSGKCIEIVDGHFGTGDKTDITNEDGTPFDWNRVFLSPSMRYCGAYCRDAKILLGKSHTVALQTRINPEAIVKSPETLNSMVLDNSVPRDELEWVIKDGSNAIIYGLLVRRSQCNL